MSDLLPCPFCGCRAYHSKYGERHYIECGECGAECGSEDDGPGVGSYEGAVSMWNARHHMQPTDGLLASMALRLHHDFGIRPKAEQEAILGIMRQIHEEVVGKGFYKPEHEEKFKKALNYSDIDELSELDQELGLYDEP